MLESLQIRCYSVDGMEVDDLTDLDECLRVRQLSTQFRNAIEDSIEDGAFCGRQRFPSLILSFPRGCCELASELLQRFLADHGISSVLVYGDCWDERYSCTQSHVWLELDDKTVVDITGDQFKNRSDSLENDIRVYCDQPDEFYVQFDIDFNFSYKMPCPLGAIKERMYEVILSHMSVE